MTMTPLLAGSSGPRRVIEAFGAPCSRASAVGSGAVASAIVCSTGSVTAIAEGVRNGRSRSATAVETPRIATATRPTSKRSVVKMPRRFGFSGRLSRPSGRSMSLFPEIIPARYDGRGPRIQTGHLLR